MNHKMAGISLTALREPMLSEETLDYINWLEEKKLVHSEEHARKYTKEKISIVRREDVFGAILLEAKRFSLYVRASRILVSQP